MFVFIYGTLALSLIGDRVSGHPIEARDTILHGFSKVYGWDYLTIVPSGSEVRGVVFEADDHDTSMMDIWEDIPVYELTGIEVTVDGACVKAFTHIMTEPPKHYETWTTGVSRPSP